MPKDHGSKNKRNASSMKAIFLACYPSNLSNNNNNNNNNNNKNNNNKVSCRNMNNYLAKKYHVVQGAHTPLPHFP